jgi:predicted peptidase
MKFLLSFFLASACLGAMETGFVNRTIQVDGESFRYVVYLPRNFSKSAKLPVILFLHGAGERGNDGLKQSDTGLGHAIRLFNDRYPAIIVMPQCKSEDWWPTPKMSKMALAALDKSVKEFKGDQDRVYLTGLSMGGYGSWAIASREPGRFAAAVIICGGVRVPERLQRFAQPGDNDGDPYARVAQKVGKLPLWIFHGGADAVVPPAESQNMVAALKVTGNEPKYTEYPGIGHNSWDKAYAEPELPKWLFAQKRQR